MRGARGGGKRGKFLGGGAEWIVEAMGKREGRVGWLIFFTLIRIRTPETASRVF
jgi:hypothetical protein